MAIIDLLAAIDREAMRVAAARTARLAKDAVGSHRPSIASPAEIRGRQSKSIELKATQPEGHAPPPRPIGQAEVIARRLLRLFGIDALRRALLKR
jgi:hypothetical protein